MSGNLGDIQARRGSYTIRLMCEADLCGVHAVQCLAHPADYHEPIDVLRSRFEMGRQFCFVAVLNEDVQAYVFAHPWQGGPPALHHILPSIDVMADHVFLHDLAVAPAHQKSSLGRALYRAVAAASALHDYAELRLVAISQASAYWRQMGFRHLAGILLHPSYGGAAQAMRLSPDGLGASSLGAIHNS